MKITKSRIIPIGSYAVVGIDPNTGRVKGNLDEVKAEQKRTQKPTQKKLFVVDEPQKAEPIDDNVESDPELQRPFTRTDRDEEESEAPKIPLPNENEVKASEAPDTQLPTSENDEDLPF